MVITEVSRFLTVATPIPTAVYTCIEEDILHCATLVAFESITGGLPLLPQPTPAPRTANNAFKPHGMLRKGEESWSTILLKTIGDELSPEARETLTNLQRDIQVSHAMSRIINTTDSSDEIARMSGADRRLKTRACGMVYVYLDADNT